MAPVHAREALSYAVSRDMAILYGVVLVGYIAMLLGVWIGATWAIRGGGAGIIGQLLAAICFLVGFTAILAGLVGFLYKVIADATDATSA